MSVPPEALPAGKGQTILLVDDEAAILEITKETLEVYGYTVVPAGDGSEALRLFTPIKDTVAVALVDSNMPGMDGRETMEELHKLNPALKIISVSGQSTDEIKGGLPGVSAFLTKPFSIASLLKTIDQVISKG